MSQAVIYSEQLRTPETIYWLISGIMVVFFIVTLAILFFDGRTIDGVVSVWAKPLKFEISLAIHAATLALVMTTFTGSARTSVGMTLLAIIFLAACVAEMGYIISQAFRAEQSHFNVSTPFHRFMWSLMAFAAIVIIGAAGVIGAASIFSSSDQLAPALKWAIVLGLVGGTILTLYTAFTIGGRMSPYVGSVPTVAESRMILTGWSLVAGDLRISHFLATHMIQVLPLFGLAVSQIAPGRIGVFMVVMVAIVWAALTLYEYREALSGKPSMLSIAHASQ